MPQSNEKTFRYSKRRRKPNSRALSMPQKRLVKSMIDKNLSQVMEKKHYDHEEQLFDVVSTYTNTSTIDILAPLQGNGDINREGDVVSLQSIFVRYYLRYSDLSTFVSMTVRVLIVQWLEDSLTTGDPSPTEFIQNLNGIHDSYNPRKIDKDSKFLILHDKFHELNRYDIASTTEVWIDKKFRKKIQFTEAGLSGVGKIYFIVLHGETTAGVNDNPKCLFRSRCRYLDG